MHVVGEAQRRPKAKRHISEKVMAKLYLILFLVKYITFLITLVTINIAADKTFGVSFWLPDGYSLSTILTAKLTDCGNDSTTTTRNGWYAFNNVTMTIDAGNNVELFTDFGGQLRTGIIFAAVSIVLGAINMRMFQENIFVLRWRNVFLHKDVLMTLDAVMLSLTFYTFYHAEDQGAVLRAYFRACNIRREVYLPYVDFTSLYVFVGAGAGGMALGCLVLLYNVMANHIEKGAPPVKQRDSDISEDEEDEEANQELRAASRYHPGHQQQQQRQRRQQQQPQSPRQGARSANPTNNNNNNEVVVRRLDARRPPPIQRPLPASSQQQQQQSVPNAATTYSNNNPAGGSNLSSAMQPRRSTPQLSSARQPSSRTMFHAPPPPPPPPPPESFYLHQNTGGM